ncbi:MAG: 4Fe-4S dicluster domain-containing protein [Acidobacteriota bacterium]
MTTTRPMALLIDITRCVGCKECVRACLEEHGLPGDYEKITGLSSKSHTALTARGELYVRELCRHCLEPSCASVCPVGAFEKTAAGPVVYDANRCMGCRYCMQACPFNVPKYQWDKAAPAVTKCDFCAPRLAAGKPTACAEACPAEATVFGAREDLLAEAHRRIAAEPKKYYPQVYGEKEVGGTSVLFLSPVPFEELGFRTDLKMTPPHLTAEALAKIPHVVSVGGALLFGIWWITNRREEVARVESEEARARRAARSTESSAREEERHDSR